MSFTFNIETTNNAKTLIRRNVVLSTYFVFEFLGAYLDLHLSFSFTYFFQIGSNLVNKMRL